MIKIEKTEVVGWEHAVRGMRNPMNSWDKSDSVFPDKVLCDHYSDCPAYAPSSAGDFCMEQCFRRSLETLGCYLGEYDHELMMKLAENGSVHAKYRRMIAVYTDITAPLYWWKEFDTYKVGTVANSCSTMHKIQEKEFTVDDFSTEHLFDENSSEIKCGDIVTSITMEIVIRALNFYCRKYLETGDKKFWWQMIQLLPSSYNQKRTVMMNYEVLAGIYIYRKDHKLDEWQDFCKWIESLPHSEIITLNKAGDTGEWREV